MNQSHTLLLAMVDFAEVVFEQSVSTSDLRGLLQAASALGKQHGLRSATAALLRETAQLAGSTPASPATDSLNAVRAALLADGRLLHDRLRESIKAAVLLRGLREDL